MTGSDKKDMTNLVYGVIADAFEQVLFPKFENIDKKFDNIDKKFDNIDKRFEQIDRRFDNVEEKIDNLTHAVEILDFDMGGVKMRLKVVEEKLDGLIDTSLVVRDHEKRIKKLERATI